MSCYRVLKSEGMIQPKRMGHNLREVAEQRRQRLTAPDTLNAVLQGDFTDYVTADGEKYHIGGVTEYLSRFNLISEVSDTETALDLIAVVEGALKEIAELGHELTSQIILVTDNGPAMKARRFRNFVKKTELLIHVRSRKYHPQTIGREERYHGSLKLEHLYRVLPNNRTELIAEVKKYRQFYNYDRLHMSLGYRTPAAVYLNKDGHTL
jgi:transposase InsO family protein